MTGKRTATSAPADRDTLDGAAAPPAALGHAVPGLLRVARGAAPASVPAKVDRFHAWYAARPEDVRRDYADIANTYYDLVTDFYEYGWGQSFHFAPWARGETFRESILRHEQWLASRLGLSRESNVLDVGCGVGGPMRTIARFAGCRVSGINNNAYQVGRARMHNQRAGLAPLCDVVEGDFMAMPFPDARFDAAYSIEATVHAASLAGVYAEIRRVLKPGSLFASYEWAMTPRFDAADPDHRRVRRDIEIANGNLHVSTVAEITDAVAAAGLELLQVEDRCVPADVPWWEKLAPSANPFALRRTSGLGKHFTALSVRVLEALRIAPRGTTAVARMLDDGGQALVAGGVRGIFTPGLLIVARKGA
jgi:sterol 24-C-methyltransferase